MSSSRRGVSNRPSRATKPSVTVASTSHHSGRVSHHARVSGSTPRPTPPASSREPDDRDHRGEVPQVERHDPGVEQHHAGPGPRPLHPAGEQRLGGEHDAGLEEAEEGHGLAGRVRVVHGRVVEADHRHRVGPGPHHRHSPPRPTAASASRRPVPAAGRRATRSRAGAPSPTRPGSWRSRPTACRCPGSPVDQPAEQQAGRPPTTTRAAPRARGWPAPRSRRRRRPRGTRSAPAPPGTPCATSPLGAPAATRHERATSQVISNGTTGTRRRRSASAATRHRAPGGRGPSARTTRWRSRRRGRRPASPGRPR